MSHVLAPPTREPRDAHVLVVDDEPPVRTILSRWLTRAGYSCAQAEDADAAWKHLRHHDVHVMTLDIAMPGRSGADLLPDVRQQFPDTEVVVLTAQDKTRVAVDALTQGAFGYLIKPVEAEELVLQVEKALERRRLLIERRQYTADLEAKVWEQTVTLRRAHEETILRLLSASWYRDEETGAHVKRTGLYCALFAEVLGWPPEQVEQVRLAAPMHDIGKIGIPDAILRKPGKLTDDELEVMKTHTLIGARMLAGSESSMLQMAQQIALCHHERWDQSGYPNGLGGERIPETARILTLVDVYDALTHHRIYRPALPEDEALAVMERGRGTQFDPSLFGVFLALVSEMRHIAQENPDEPETADGLQDPASLIHTTSHAGIVQEPGLAPSQSTSNTKRVHPGELPAMKLGLAPTRTVGACPNCMRPPGPGPSPHLACRR